jgi:hypothetical protein
MMRSKAALLVEHDLPANFQEGDEETMKSTARWSIVGVMAGMFVLTSAGQTKNDDVAGAQGRTPVMMYRFYEGTDGLSHVEKIEVNFDEHKGSDDIAKLMAVSGAQIRRTKPSPPGTVFSALPFHPGSHRQYIFNLSGHEEIEFSGGEKITLNPGDIELVEDTAPSKGHRNLVPGPEDRVTLWVPLADQTVVRGSILNGAAPHP